jgi:hypothetical protein
VRVATPNVAVDLKKSKRLYFGAGRCFGALADLLIIYLLIEWMG